MELLQICRQKGETSWMARTAEGGLMRRDGGEGDFLPYDFNGLYRGYYAECTFTALAVAGGMFCAAGMDKDGLPHLFESLKGEVWEERNLTAHLPGGGKRRVTGAIREILGDEESGLRYLICENGQLVTLPDCPKCLRIVDLGKEPAIGGRLLGDEIAVSFSDGEERRIGLGLLAQYRVSREYAKGLLAGGAALVDLRTPEEYEEEHLPGAVNVPAGGADGIEGFLRGKSPGDRMIFVCRTGLHADEAAEHARRRGFLRAYSLGGMSSWFCVK